MRTLSVFLPAIILGAFLFTGCFPTREPGPSVPKSVYLNWPGLLNDVRFRWAADPGIDLLTGPAVPVRAYMESWAIGRLTRTPSSNLYPGFDRSVAADPDGGPIRPEGQKPVLEGPYFGNGYFHILSIEPLDKSANVYVCQGMYNIYHPAPDQPGKLQPVSSDPFVWRVNLSKDGEEPPKKPQSGRLPAPVDDVFKGWHIDRVTYVDGGYPDWDFAEKFDRRCKAAMPHNSVQQRQISETVLDSPPKTEPAVPGWPDNQA